MPGRVDEHVVRLDVAVHIAQVVDRVDRQHLQAVAQVITQVRWIDGN